MKRIACSFAVILLVWAVFAVSQVRAQTLSSFPTFGESEYLRYNAKFKRAFDAFVKKERAILGYEDVTASTTATSVGAYSVIIIRPANVASSKLTIGTSAATDGQILYVVNRAASDTNIFCPTNIATATANGGNAHFIFASGSWSLLEDN